VWSRHRASVSLTIRVLLKFPHSEKTSRDLAGETVICVLRRPNCQPIDRLGMEARARANYQYPPWDGAKNSGFALQRLLLAVDENLFAVVCLVGESSTVMVGHPVDQCVIRQTKWIAVPGPLKCSANLCVSRWRRRPASVINQSKGDCSNGIHETNKIRKDKRRKHRHWLATIFYLDCDRFARAYTVRKKAIAFAERQRKYFHFKGHLLFTRIPAVQN
jgi:hypothetical protein